MRISLNQKPKSSHDFGFQTNWDSMGAVVKSLQPGINKQMDEICFVNHDINGFPLSSFFNEEIISS